MISVVQRDRDGAPTRVVLGLTYGDLARLREGRGLARFDNLGLGYEVLVAAAAHHDLLVAKVESLAAEGS
jgi:hypothetical protein